MHCSVVSTEAGTLNSVLCSSVQLKTEQFTCFARTFPMPLELVHCLRFRKHNGGTVGGNLQIMGR